MAELKRVEDMSWDFILYDNANLMFTCMGRICELTPRLKRKAKEAPIS